MCVFMASRLRLRGQPSRGARRLRQIILPSFLAYYPRPSLSPPFDLRIFTVSCVLEREGVDSRLPGNEANPNGIVDFSPTRVAFPTALLHSCYEHNHFCYSIVLM